MTGPTLDFNQLVVTTCSTRVRLPMEARAWSPSATTTGSSHDRRCDWLSYLTPDVRPGLECERGVGAGPRHRTPSFSAGRGGAPGDRSRVPHRRRGRCRQRDRCGRTTTMGHPAVHPDDEGMREGMRTESPHRRRGQGRAAHRPVAARRRRRERRPASPPAEPAPGGAHRGDPIPPPVQTDRQTRHIRLRSEVAAYGERPRRGPTPAPAAPRPIPSTVRNDHREQP